MNWAMKLVPLSFLLGAVAGPLSMLVFQKLKRASTWLDSQEGWAKNAWFFVLAQAVGIISTMTQQGISCDMEVMTASACLAQFTPNVIKAIIVQLGAVVSFKLKKTNPNS